jgi:ribosomal protein S6E (S10)
MKRVFCFFIFSSLLLLQNTAATVDEMRNMNIPIVVINTINKETPTCDYAHAPEGQDGITSINHTKVSARMYIIQQNDTLYDSGEYVDGISGLTIRIRGNTSAYGYPMKPYKLNLQKKADLLLRGDKKYNDKDWLLLNDYKLNTIVGNKVSELLSHISDNKVICHLYDHLCQSLSLRNILDFQIPGKNDARDRDDRHNDPAYHKRLVDRNLTKYRDVKRECIKYSGSRYI